MAKKKRGSDEVLWDRVASWLDKWGVLMIQVVRCYIDIYFR